eukprot:CAMPEP_0180571536 /NCGR_PEP_ID=MMETSP1037_2-20121125/8771_1 /TAXON_ID=632150 /ORGANISM="Azadinium spinosum, Strain 3D9" /LENGTH=773 /DNA_ID=CAMNT_0022588859 /DNA_START=70 /DNA_END=2389 /DNA_ORIENTATION=+
MVDRLKALRRDGLDSMQQRVTGLFNWQGNYTEQTERDQLEADWSQSPRQAEAPGKTSGTAPRDETPWNHAATVRAQLQEELKRERPINMGLAEAVAWQRVVSVDGAGGLGGRESEDDGAQRRERSEKRRHSHRQRVRSDPEGTLPSETACDPFAFPKQMTPRSESKDHQESGGQKSSGSWDVTSGSVWPRAGPAAAAWPIQGANSAEATAAMPAEAASVEQVVAAGVGVIPRSRSQGGLNSRNSSHGTALQALGEGGNFVAAECGVGPLLEPPPRKDQVVSPGSARSGMSGPAAMGPAVQEPEAGRAEPCPGQFDEAILAALSALPRHSLVDIVRRLAQRRPAEVELALAGLKSVVTAPALTPAPAPTPSPIEAPAPAPKPAPLQQEPLATSAVVATEATSMTGPIVVPSAATPLAAAFGSDLLAPIETAAISPERRQNSKELKEQSSAKDALDAASAGVTKEELVPVAPVLETSPEAAVTGMEQTAPSMVEDSPGTAVVAPQLSGPSASLTGWPSVASPSATPAMPAVAPGPSFPNPVAAGWPKNALAPGTSTSTPGTSVPSSPQMGWPMGPPSPNPAAATAACSGAFISAESSPTMSSASALVSPAAPSATPWPGMADIPWPPMGAAAPVLGTPGHSPQPTSLSARQMNAGNPLSMPWPSSGSPSPTMPVAAAGAAAPSSAPWPDASPSPTMPVAVAGAAAPSAAPWPDASPSPTMPSATPGASVPPWPDASTAAKGMAPSPWPDPDLTKSPWPDMGSSSTLIDSWPTQPT